MYRILAAAALLAPGAIATSAAPPLPEDLRGTGYFTAAKVAFEPRHPLWTDGAAKRRWIALPAGKAVDATRPDEWRFPPGTRLWKEFGYGKPVETRLIERLADGSWRYATYVWNAEGTAAKLAAEAGATLAVADAPGGRYTLPSRLDCLACHEGTKVPVLGFSALQLGPQLADFADRRMLQGLPPEWRGAPPRIAGRDAAERAALGYLHGNCGHCHNDHALEGVEFPLQQSAADPEASARRAREALVGASRYRAHGSDTARRVVPGDPAASVIAQRMRSTNPMVRMPPLGTALPHAEGIAAVEHWIQELQHHVEGKP